MNENEEVYIDSAKNLQYDLSVKRHDRLKEHELK